MVLLPIILLIEAETANPLRYELSNRNPAFFMLTCDQIACERNDQRLFSGVGFTAGQGSLIEIRGGNGTGKTTLLHALLGLFEPVSGAVKWSGVPIADLREDYAAELCYVGHEDALKPTLGVMQHLRFWATLSDGDALLDPAMHYFGLQRIKDMQVRQLSRGWKRRLALSKLMISRSKLWILDEPLSNLDEEGQQTIRTLLQARAEQGGIVILTNHQQPIPESAILQLEDFQ